MLQKLAIFTAISGAAVWAQTPLPPTQATLQLFAHQALLLTLPPAQPDVRTNFAVDGQTAADVSVLGSSATMLVSLIDPNGVEHFAGNTDAIVSNSFAGQLPNTGEGGNYEFVLTSPPPGMWTLHVFEPMPFTGLEFARLQIWTDSDLVATVLGGNEDYPTNQPVSVGYMLLDRQGALPPGAVTVAGQLQLPGQLPTAITFHDDGMGDDAVAGDGIFTATFTVATAGAYNVVVTATGVSRSGLPFIRTSSGTITAADPCVTLNGTFQSSFDPSAGLSLTLPVTMIQTATVLAQVTLTAVNGSQARGSAFATLPSGTGAITIPISMDWITSLQANGPYQVSVANLACVDPTTNDAHTSDQMNNLGPTVAVNAGVTGNLTPPTINAPMTVDFGTVTLGQQVTPMTFNVTNSGGGTLAIMGITAPNAPFGLVSPTASSTPFNVPASGMTFTVSFSPTAAGNYSDTVVIASNDPASPWPVNLKANAVAPPLSISLSAASLNFPNVLIQTSSTPQQLTVTNTGGTNVTVTAATSAPFSVSPKSLTLSPKQSLPFNVTFSPTTAAGASGSLTISTGSPNDPPPVTLGGTVIAPVISVNPTNLNFQQVVMGTTSKMNLTISNTGNGTLTVMSLSLSPSTGPFSLLSPPTTPFNVPATGTTLTVQFAPTSVSTPTANLTITSNGSTTPLTIPITGAGISNGGGTGYITGLKLEAGTYDTNTHIFTPYTNELPWDTDDSNPKNYAIGVSTPSTTAPLLNVPGKKALASPGIAPGHYYFYFSTQLTYLPYARLTVLWSDNTPDVILFQSGGANPWIPIGTPSNASITVDPNSALTAGYPCRVYQNMASPGPCQANDVFDVTITGSGGATGPPSGGTPKISPTSQSLTFGPLTLGQAPATNSFSISNTGTADLHVQTIALSGDPSFTLVSAPTLPQTVSAVGPPLTVRMQYAPTAAKTVTGSVTVSSDGGTMTVNLSGTANAAVGTCAPVPANLVSWWPGEGNSNDLTGGNNGSIVGGTTFATGEAGKAFQFDGSTGYVELNNPANLQLTSALTIEAWINPHALPTAPAGINPFAAILTKWAQNFSDVPNSDAYGLWLTASGGQGNLTSYIHQSGGSEPFVQSGAIPLNTWTHAAVTFDSASGILALYVNGKMVSGVVSKGPIVGTAHNVNIGHEESSQPRFFNGLIDEASVYSRALSGSEIQAIFNAGSAGKCTGTSLPPTGPSSGVTIVGLKLESGNYDTSSHVFTPYTNQGPWDTDDTNPNNYAIGVSAPSITAPLLNLTGKKGLASPGISPGHYYFYLTPENTYLSYARLTLIRSDNTPDVILFQSGGENPWAPIGSPSNASIFVNPSGVGNPCRVYKNSTSPPGGCPGNDVFDITIQ